MLYFVDGLGGDNNLPAERAIIDQGGPGIRPIAPVPILSEWGMIILSFFLLFLGYLVTVRTGVQTLKT